MSPDPVAEVLERAIDGLPPGDSDAFRRAIEAGLAEIDALVTREDLAIEIAEVARIPADQRLRWARRFADQRRVFTLRRRSFDLVRAFHRGAEVGPEARQLLAEAEGVLAGELDGDVRHELGDVALECRYILSGGVGPASLRTSKAH